MSRVKSTYFLRCWRFTPPDGGKPVNIQAVFDMTEAIARQRLLDKGRDVTGWAAEQSDIPVHLEEVGEPSQSGKWAVTVTCFARASHTFEVEADDEEAANDAALEEAEAYDFWDFDGDEFEVQDCEEVPIG